MKWMGAWAAGVLLLAACGGSTDVDLQGVDSATVSYTNGVSYSTRYTFARSERVLIGAWSKHGPGGFRSEQEARSLSEEQAARLQGLVDGIRLAESSQPGTCWEDIDSLSLLLTDNDGAEKSYPTDPERQRCNGAKLFAEKADVQAFLDACREILPEPTL